MVEIGESYTEQEVLIANYCKAFGHPARIAIVRLLKNTKGYFAGEIVDRLPITQSSVSQHLKVLRNTGVIDCEYITPKVRYSFNEKVFNTMVKQKTKYFSQNKV